ncbi:MAG: hypothetical protein A3F83_14380 [Candidatus Glassbacteria bacterium RIFCSPLOWO2_12_FULL_58_11]|uniref:Glutamine amidotransferase domain-containing protein n=1 Tax=Candidatus Glassbacteria bacterium RIFCSPLOWO2_12_FULL_58_11 TaxID=1817867 RepID=A0A1F5YU48_9BACT|nr:MAG: hypothetical protein A3F83_14380 [Candidatus Glassbacteria bacterium RIFCSPLOWO2_12_FULL_58_11]
MWLALLPLAALLVVLWTYRKTYPPLSRPYHILLVVLRVTVVLLTGLLIFEPATVLSRDRERPERVALLLDRSASMLLPVSGRGGRSDTSRIEAAEKLVRENTKSAGLAVFTFGDELHRADSSQGQGAQPEVEDRTDLASALHELSSRSRESWDRVYVVSDGRINAGRDPLLESGGLPPVESVLAGEPPEAPDLALAGFELLRPVYEGGRVELELSVALAPGTAGAGTLPEAALCDFYLDSRKVAEKKISLGRTGAGFAGEEISFPAPPAGGYWLKAVLRPLEGEWTALNNERLIRLEVAKSRPTLLLVSNAPDWDYAFLRRAFELNAEWQVEGLIVLRGEQGGEVVRREDARGGYSAGRLPDDKKLAEVDFLLLHGRLNDYENSFLNHIAGRAQKGGLALVFWPAGEIKPDAFPAALLSWLPFVPGPAAAVLVRAPEGPSTINTLDRYNILAGLGGGAAFDNLPPVQWVYRGIALKSRAEVLARAGQRSSGEPGAALLAAMPVGESRTAAVLGEGLWRWHMLSQDTPGGRDTRYYRLWEALAGWLMSGEKKSGLVFAPALSVFPRGAKVGFKGAFDTVGGDSATGRARVTVEVRRLGEAGQPMDTVAQSTLELDAGETNFSFILGRLRPGLYEFTGRVGKDGEELNKEGRFAVESYSPEMAAVAVDSTVLGALSASTGGRLTRLSDPALAIKTGTTTEPVTRTFRMSYDFWIYLLLAALLSTEWALRKRKALA